MDGVLTGRRRPDIEVAVRVRGIIERDLRERGKALERDLVVVLAATQHVQRIVHGLRAIHQANKGCLDAIRSRDVDALPRSHGIGLRTRGREAHVIQRVNQPTLTLPLSQHGVKQGEGVIGIFRRRRLADTENAGHLQREIDDAAGIR